MAADMPVKAPPRAAPAAFSWSGCYIGANGGWIESREKYRLAPGGNYSNAAGGLAPPNAAGTGLLAGDRATASHAYLGEDSGGTFGGQVGCNRQVGAWVFGGEADLNWSDISNSVRVAYGPVPSENPLFTISPQTDIVTSKLEWFSTIRARVGYAFDRFMVFGTAGLVVGNVKSTTNVSFTTSGTSPVYSGASHIGSNSETRAGLTAGGGVEWAVINNWSVKAEYLFLDLGRHSYSSALVTPATALPGYTWTTAQTMREHVVRVGLNYRFDWAGPLVAAY
jgi:outer membrane immunogenic protein